MSAASGKERADNRTSEVEYDFTELSRTLERPVASLFEWTTEYADVVRAAQVRLTQQPATSGTPHNSWPSRPRFQYANYFAAQNRPG
jgi:hypothetical protein